ncbi:MAG: hypothetical protein JXA04_11975 [Gammaproteobacteria bacterium]|nr:hypothetical protein [Gammaproteobacteria bacterium]
MTNILVCLGILSYPKKQGKLNQEASKITGEFEHCGGFCTYLEKWIQVF